MRTSVSGISDQARHEPDFSIIEDSFRLEIKDGLEYLLWRKQRTDGDQLRRSPSFFLYVQIADFFMTLLSDDY